MGTPILVGLPKPATTTVPALRIDEKPWAMCSPVVTPVVMMVLSAPWPLVCDSAYSVACSMVAKARVAPNESANSRLRATGQRR